MGNFVLLIELHFKRRPTLHAGDALRFPNRSARPDQFSESYRERRPHRARLMPSVIRLTTRKPRNLISQLQSISKTLDRHAAVPSH